MLPTRGSSPGLTVFDSAEAIGEFLSRKLLDQIEVARATGRVFLLGCPTGRTPKPLYAAISRHLAAAPQDISHLRLVMMDEYLDRTGARFRYASEDVAWSCHRFSRVEIADSFNAALPAEYRLAADSIWFPDADKPEAYDETIEHAGGIDFFILASGASDGHVAFNPPGSPRDSRTRVVELSEETRRDNLKTFPELRTLAKVPTHGVSVGIDTIARARDAAMILTGTGKAESLRRVLGATSYDSDWPATVIHEFSSPQILADEDAAGER